MVDDTDNDLPIIESSDDTPPSGGDTLLDTVPPPVFTEDTPHSPGGSLRDRALEGLPGDVRAAVVAASTDMGVTDKNDAT